eukprot:4925925-Prorocentrum_lima.AAC.1
MSVAGRWRRHARVTATTHADAMVLTHNHTRHQLRTIKTNSLARRTRTLRAAPARAQHGESNSRY